MRRLGTVLFVVLIISIDGQSLAAEMTLAHQAEQAGNRRQALTHYVEALKADSANQQLREKIISLTWEIVPPPEIPREARRHMTRGRVAVENARDKEGFLRASYEFEKAVYYAPWLAEAYYNLGAVSNSAGKYPEAIWALKQYLLIKPQATDAVQVEDLIYEIEYRKESGYQEMTYDESVSKLIGVVSSIERDWGFIIIKVDQPFSVKVEDTIWIKDDKGITREMTVNKSSGNQVSTIPSGNLNAIAIGSKVFTW